jgi:NAD(P)-dependent dehydrogenase (short-subunit alcohol dehydrogenase family)
LPRKVAICISRPRTKADLERAKESIQARHNVSVTIHAVDLSNGDAARSLAAPARHRHPGEQCRRHSGRRPAGDRRGAVAQAWDLKVFGYVNMCRAVYPAMKARGGGVIVNVLGAAGERPTWGYIAGSAGNASLMAFTRGMGGTSLVDRIRIVACNPGLIRTERMETMLRASAEAKFGDPARWQELIPTSPPVGTPEQCADLVAFLASDRASHIAGTVVTIDGGRRRALQRGPCSAAKARKEWRAVLPRRQTLGRDLGGGAGAGEGVVGFNNHTLRMNPRISLGGDRLRVRISNAYGNRPLAIGAAQIALRDKGPAIVADSGRKLSFGGSDSAVIAAGAVLFSDPVELSVPPLADLAVSFHLPGEVLANFRSRPLCKADQLHIAARQFRCR